MDKLLLWAMEIQSLAQAGLAYTNNKYDIERYERLREISAEIMSEKTDLPITKIKGLFCNETGYQTPKIDTRAAIFQHDKILLVHENNNTWSLPGGWCDVDQSIASNVMKEVKEETGLNVRPDKLIAVQDWRKHNVINYAYGVCKIFVLCQLLDGEFVKNIETIETKYFSCHDLPENLAKEKTTLEQIKICFQAFYDDNWQTQFD